MADIYERVRDHTNKFLAAITRMIRRNRIEQREELFALHSFTPARGHKDQLAFVEHDEFILRSDSDEKWWLVKHKTSGRRGYVPMSYVARKSEQTHMEWYDMRMSRDDAMRKLSDEKYAAGSFIIRTKDNMHFTHGLALTVKTKAEDDSRILHYVIYREDDKFRIGVGKMFPTLTHLVQYYAGHQSGLKQPLTFSVKQKRLIDVWEIDHSELTKGELLGSGWFGEVYKGKLYGEDVAVKTVKLTRMSKEEFMREADIARKFSHMNIVRVIGVCSAEPCIVTEYLRGGSLKDYLKKTPLLSAREYVPIAQKIICAMVHLEDRGFVHRDLAARNILVGDDHNTIKLADFGLARSLGESEYYSAKKAEFPIKWTAPEAFVIKGNSVMENQNGKCTSASDVWSFAVVLWEIYSKGEEPYHEFKTAELIYQKLTDEHENWRLLCPTGCPPQIYNKMNQCWSLDPTKRPSFAQLHDFFLNPYGSAQ